MGQSGEDGNGQGGRDRHEEKQCRGDEQARGECGAAPKPPRRAGQQPGAPGHGRTQSLPVDHEEHHHPEQCAGCVAVLSEANPDRIHSASLAIDPCESAADCARLAIIQTSVWQSSTNACMRSVVLWGRYSKATPARSACQCTVVGWKGGQSYDQRQHAIGGMKIFYCLTQHTVFAITSIALINQLFIVSVGLWSLKIA
jgi:hypothetical protein